MRRRDVLAAIVVFGPAVFVLAQSAEAPKAKGASKSDASRLIVMPAADLHLR